jgi:molybdenum cofactor biosynthesis protein B
MGHHQHKANAPKSLKVAVLSVSTTRTLENDVSGLWIAEQAVRHGHEVVAHQVVTDAIEAVRQAVTHLLAETQPQAVIVTGGTGVSPKDLTIEALRPLMAKELSAFGAIFAQLSYQEIGSAALISRATAGVISRSLIFCLPGSLKACQLACNTLIFPELGHLQGHVAEG